MADQMIVRLDGKLKSKVARLAKAEGKSVSEVVRGLLNEYVRDRDMGAYIDDLWDRMGAKLRAKRRTVKDIPRAIRDVRARS